MSSVNMNTRICVIGLGYVGLPLSIELAKEFHVIGYDVDQKKIDDLNNGIDANNEVSEKSFNEVKKNLFFTSDKSQVKSQNFYIVTVPTPIDKNNIPDLQHLESASALIGSCLKIGDCVVYESTVYPGCTEDFCLPILSKISNLKLNKDFHIGYSPERINPGDTNNNVRNIAKVISASSKVAEQKLYEVYSKVVDVDIFTAASIKTAEMSKVIENTQRDINIALINEISIICRKMNISTNDVLKAAGTKWNFLNFTPGLVGGHCIGVDPYYLTHKSKEIGYEPGLILSGRNLNDSFGIISSEEIINLYNVKYNSMPSNALFIGCTFKENVSDVRNSKVFDMVKFFENKGIKVDCYDPIANTEIVKKYYNKILLNQMPDKNYCIIIVAVPHEIIIKSDISKIKSLCKENHVIADLKSVFKKEDVDFQL